MGDGERINKVSKTMKLTELQILKEEEKVLMGISSKLNDQLNRLKVIGTITGTWRQEIKLWNFHLHAA